MLKEGNNLQNQYQASISQAWFLFVLKSSVSAFYIGSMAGFTPKTK